MSTPSTSTQANPSFDKHLYRITEAAKAAGRLRSVKQGRSRLIPASAIADYIALLEAEAKAEVA